MAYADNEGLSGQDRSDFLYLIRALDAYYLKRMVDQSESKLKKSAPKKGSTKIGGKKL